jgi:MFS family permease
VRAVTGAQWRLATGLFVVAWGTNVSTPLILRYQDRLDLSDTGAVGIFTVYVAGILLALLFAGRSSDRFGRRPVVLPFTLLSAIGSLVMLAGRDSLVVLFAGRFLLGAVSGSMLSVGTAWLNELPNDRIDRLRLATMTTLIIYAGFGFGPITSALWDRFGEAPLVVPYLLHAVACVVVLAVLITLPETKPRDPSVSLRPRLGVPAEARAGFVRVLAPSSVWVFGFPSVGFALLPIVLREAVGSDAEVLVAGAIGSLTALSVLLARPILDRMGSARRAIPVGMWSGVAGYLVGGTAFVTDAWWLAPSAAVLLGTASGVLMSSGLVLTEEISNDSNRGALSATFYLAAYSGMAMPVVITLLARPTSTAAALGAITVVAVAVTAGVTRQLRVLGVEAAT